MGAAFAGALVACGNGSGPDTRTLALSVDGTGDGRGTIASSPAGINCTIAAGVASGTCQASFRHGTAVTLTATASDDGTFEGWAGACSGASTCQVTLDQARSVTASFAVATYTISVRPAPGNTGIGSVVSNPAGINCQISANLASGGCISTFVLTSNVSLQATPAAGFEFTGWGGECGGSPCTRAKGQTQVVTAQFTPRARAW